MKLTYIYNSCFVIEEAGLTLIFDYYRDSSGKAKDGVLHNDLLKNEGRKYIFCSHSHPDHFNREILTWKQDYQDMTYIFSKELLDSGKAKPEDAIYLDKLQTYNDDMLEIKAYGSTDVGGSFIIRRGDRIIFHAGDLNNWHWNEESTKKEVLEAEAYFQRELELLSGEIKHINLAMFPVDPRLGKEYMLGAEQLVSAIKVDYFSPMHFGKHYDKIAAFASFAAQHQCKCICWEKRGETFIL